MAVSNATSDDQHEASHSDAQLVAATNAETKECIDGEQESAPWKRRARARLHKDVEPKEDQRFAAAENPSDPTVNSTHGVWTPPVAVASDSSWNAVGHGEDDKTEPQNSNSLSSEIARSLAAATDSSWTPAEQDAQDTLESQNSVSAELSARLAAARANSAVEAYLKELRWRPDGFQRLSAAITYHPNAWDIFAMVLRWFPKRQEILASALSERPGDYGSWAQTSQSQPSQASVADSSVAQAVSGSPVVNEDVWENPVGFEENEQVETENAICLSSDEEQEVQPQVGSQPLASQAVDSVSGELHCELNVDHEFGHSPVMVSISLGNADGLKCNWYEESALIFRAAPVNENRSAGGSGKEHDDGALAKSGNCLDDLLQVSDGADSSCPLEEREVWTQCLDPRTGRVYYHNDQDTRWERPTGPNVCIKTASGALETSSPVNVSSIYNNADSTRRPTMCRSDGPLRLPVSHVKGVHIGPDGQQIILIFMPSLEFVVASSQMRVQIPTLNLTFRADDAAEAAETLLRWLPHAEVEDYASARDLSTTSTPPILRLGRLQVRPRDLLFMNDGDFLNDTILDFILRLALELVAPAELQESVYLASTFFFKQLTAHGADTGERGWENVRTWTRHLSGGLMSRECMFVPMNANEVHWWLAVVCRPNGNCLKGPQRIVCLDSSPYPFTERDRIKILKGYLNREWKERGGGAPPAEPLKAVMAAQAKQRNLVDCGVFSIEYMVHLFRNPTAFASLGNKKQRLWFSQLRVSHRRQRLRWMISRLAAAGIERKEVDVHTLLKDDALRRLVLDAFLDDPPPQKKTLGLKLRRKFARHQEKLKKTRKRLASSAVTSQAVAQSQPTAAANGSLAGNERRENDRTHLESCIAENKFFDKMSQHPAAGDAMDCITKQDLDTDAFRHEEKRARVVPPPRGKAQSKICAAPSKPMAAQTRSNASDAPPLSAPASLEMSTQVSNATMMEEGIRSPSSLLPSPVPLGGTTNSSIDRPISQVTASTVSGREGEIFSSHPAPVAADTELQATPNSSSLPSDAPPSAIHVPPKPDVAANLNIMLRKNIEIMARQVVKLGKSFEDLVLKSNVGKPQFSFLYGGEGSEYYLQVLTEERAHANSS